VDASAAIVIVHVPGESAFSANVDPDGCAPGGVAVQIGSVKRWIRTGSDGGVPAGTVLGFVRSADATIVSSPPPMLIVAEASDAFT
jgi:hypothetical protein